MNRVPICGSKLRLHRIAKNLTCHELETRCGMYRGALYYHEVRNLRMPEDKFHLVCEILNVTPEDLLIRETPLQIKEPEAPKVPETTVVPVPPVVIKAVAEPLDPNMLELLKVIQDEEAKKGSQISEIMGRIVQAIANGKKAIEDTIPYLDMATEEYSRSLHRDSRASILSRITGNHYESTASNDAKAILDQVSSLESYVTRMGEELRGILNLGSVPTTRPVEEPTSEGEPVPDTTPPVNTESEPSNLKDDSSVVPEVSVEEPTSRPKTIVIVGGSRGPHEECIKEIEAKGIRVEFIGTSHGKSMNQVDSLIAKARFQPNLLGVIIIKGYISHTISNKVVAAMRTHEVPYTFSYNQSDLQIMKAVGTLLS